MLKYVEVGGREQGGEMFKCWLILTCIESNLIGEGGVVALARALEHNSSITTFDVGVCGIRSVE